MTKREVAIIDFNGAMTDGDLVGVCVVADRRTIEAGGRYGNIKSFAGLVASLIAGAANDYGITLDEVAEQINAALAGKIEYFDVRRK